MNFQIAVDALNKIIGDIINFIPNLINGLIILIIGVLISLFIGWLLNLILLRSKFDLMVERVGLTGAIRMLGIQTPLSKIFSQTVFILLLLSFLITSTKIMGLIPVSQLFETMLAFIPTLIAAAIFFLLGSVVAQLIGNTVAALASANGINNASFLGKVFQYLINVFVVIISLGIMGMDTAILVTSVTIMTAAFGLAIGLAFGLGAKGVIQHILAGYYIKKRFQTGQAISIEQVSGTVGGIGGVNTVIETAEGAVIFPNELLLESIVVRKKNLIMNLKAIKLYKKSLLIRFL
jgi:small-conductance mechanosensitive channel